MPKIRYRVMLTEEEREELQEIATRGRVVRVTWTDHRGAQAVISRLKGALSTP